MKTKQKPTVPDKAAFVAQCQSLEVGEWFDIPANPLPQTLTNAVSSLNQYGDRQIEHAALRRDTGTRRVIRIA